MTEYFLFGKSILFLHFLNPDLHSGFLLVVVHPAAIVGGNDAAVVICQHTGLYQYVAGGLDQVCKVNLAPGSHVVYAPHVHAGRNRLRRGFYPP